MTKHGLESPPVVSHLDALEEARTSFAKAAFRALDRTCDRESPCPGTRRPRPLVSHQLRLYQQLVSPATRDEFFVPSAFHNLAVVEDEDVVRVPNGG